MRYNKFTCPGDLEVLTGEPGVLTVNANHHDVLTNVIMRSNRIDRSTKEYALICATLWESSNQVQAVSGLIPVFCIFITQ